MYRLTFKVDTQSCTLGLLVNISAQDTGIKLDTFCLRLNITSNNILLPVQVALYLVILFYTLRLVSLWYPHSFFVTTAPPLFMKTREIDLALAGLCGKPQPYHRRLGWFEWINRGFQNRGPGHPFLSVNNSCKSPFGRRGDSYISPPELWPFSLPTDSCYRIRCQLMAV